MNLQQQILKLAAESKRITDEIKALETQTGLLLIGIKDADKFLWLRDNNISNDGPDFIKAKVKRLVSDKDGNLWFSGNDEEYRQECDEARERIEEEFRKILKELDVLERLRFTEEMVDALDREYGLK